MPKSRSAILQQEGLVKKILKNEVGQVISIIGVIWFFVQMIILPLQKVSDKVNVLETNHLAHIEQDIIGINKTLNDFNAEHEEFNRQLGEINGTLKTLIR